MGHENVGDRRAGRARGSSSARAWPRATGSSSSTTSAASTALVPRGGVPPLRAHRLAHQPRRPPLRLHLRGEPGDAVGRLRAVHVPAVERRDAQGARRGVGRAGRPGHAAVQRHRVGAERRRRRLRLDGAHPGPGAAGAVPGGRLQAGRRLARSSSPAPPGTPPGWRWPGTSAPTTSSTSAPRTRWRGSWSSPAAWASTSSWTAPSGAGTAPVLLGIDALKRREGVMVTQGELAAFPDFPLKKMTEKAIATAERPRPQLPRRRAGAGSSWPPAGSRWSGSAPTPSGSRTSTTRSGRSAARPARTSSTSRCCRGSRARAPRERPSSAAPRAPTAPPSTGWPRSACPPCTRRRAAPACSTPRCARSTPAPASPAPR